MKRFTNTLVTPIGIDVGSQQVKLVQLSGREKHWRVASAAVIPRMQAGITLDAAEVRHIEDVILRRGFHGHRVVLAVPSHKLLAGMLELPPAASGVPIPQIARMELARTHRRDPHSFELAYWELPKSARVGEVSHVYAAACSHDDADQYLDLFESQGLDVLGLDVQSTAVARACSGLINNDAAVTAVLDVGWLSARLVLVHQGAIVFERTFEEGGVEPVHRVLSHRFSLESKVVAKLLRQDEQGTPTQDTPLEEVLSEIRGVLAAQFEAIVQELNVSFSYATHQFPDAMVDQILLLGGGATMLGICEYLADALEVRTAVVRPCDLATCGGELGDVCNNGLLTTALGLALWREE